MMFLRLQSSVFLLLIFTSAAAETVGSSSARATVLEAAYTEFPPLTYTDADGNPAGRYIELSKQVAAEAGYELRWRSLPISRIYLFLASGELDFWPGVGGLPHLQSQVVESRHTLMFLTLAAFHRPETPGVTGFDDLQGHRLVVMAGYTYLGTLDHLKADPETSFHHAPGHEEGLWMLLLGRGDYLIDYVEPMSQVLLDNPAARVEASALMSSRLAFVMSRRTENAEAAMGRFDEAYIRLIQDGFSW